MVLRFAAWRGTLALGCRACRLGRAMRLGAQFASRKVLKGLEPPGGSLPPAALSRCFPEALRQRDRQSPRRSLSASGASQAACPCLSQAPKGAANGLLLGGLLRDLLGGLLGSFLLGHSTSSVSQTPGDLPDCTLQPDATRSLRTCRFQTRSRPHLARGPFGLRSAGQVSLAADDSFHRQP